MRIGMLALAAVVAFGWFLTGAPGQALAVDVAEEAEQVGDKTKGGLETGTDAVKGAVKDVTEKVTDRSLWDRFPPYLALPAALIVGILLGLVVGRVTKKDGKGKKKK